MNSLFSLDLSVNAVIPEFGAPPPARVIAGSPQFRTWEIEAHAGGLFAGVWESTPGKWRIEYDEWEYFRILFGFSIVCEIGFEPKQLRAGDSLIIRPGFKGTWEVVETTRKEFIIRV
ncbi:MAG: cupin domain-containing protein [Parvularculaceae bacterium]|nr:cupin domain-containing protein [Parvularculaceae bacterium]